MNVKEYKVFRSINKTAKNNNLIVLDNKRLFDLSLLDDLNISEKEKGLIINNIKNIFNSNLTSFYGKKFDDFTACDGIAEYHRHRIFSKQGTHLYTIFELYSVKNYSKTCESIYDTFYDVKETTLSSNYDAPLDDVEI